MAIVNEVAVATAIAFSVLESTDEYVFESIDVYEFGAVEEIAELASSAVFSDAAAVEDTPHLVSVAVFTEALAFDVAATKEIEERSEFSDRVAMGYEVALAEAAVFTDLHAIFPTLLLYDAGLFTSAVGPVLEAQVSVTERAELADKVGLGFGENVSEAAQFTDTEEISRVVTEIIGDGAVFTDGGGAAALVDAAAFDAAVFATEVLNSAVTHALAYSFGVFISKVDYLDPEAGAWVMATETTAMSQYKGYDFDSVAQYKGVLYGVNRDGIFKLEGEKDEGLLVNALLETGYLDFDIDEKKRIPNLYVGFTMAGGVIRLSTWSRMNPAQKYHYDTPVLPYKQPVNSRFTLGKGLNHEYWKFALTNRNGAYFALDKMSADVAISARRIG